MVDRLRLAVNYHQLFVGLRVVHVGDKFLFLFCMDYQHIYNHATLYYST